MESKTMAEKLLEAFRLYKGGELANVILGLGLWDIDEEVTRLIDPRGMSDIAVLTDGSAIRRDATNHEWQVMTPAEVQDLIRRKEES